MMVFVAVHTGAGSYSLDRLEECQKVAKNAIKSATQVQGVTASCVRALEFLENSPHTNSGIGSNLNFDGEVECEAGIMDTNGSFGAISGLKFAKNPIFVARELANLRTQTGANEKLLLPLVLSGSGADVFAKRCSDCEISLSLKTSESIKTYKSVLKKLKFQQGSCNVDELFDTVGAICVGSTGEMCVGCSSGGPLLKMPGRQGPTSQFGTGFWAEKRGNHSFGIVTSGVGEAIIRTQFASNLVKMIMSKMERNNSIDFAEMPSIINEFFHRDFLNSQLLALDSNLNRPEHKLVGALLVIFDAENCEGEMFCMHNTEDFLVAHSSKGSNGKSILSRSENQRLVLSSVPIRL